MPASNVDRLIASRADQVHRLKARDSTGRWAYYFVHVPAVRERAFLAALKEQSKIDLQDYGQVIASCYGEEPNEEVKRHLKERYGFDV